jgi:hypothetical protein
MSSAGTILDLDIGSVTLCLVELTPSRELMRQVYLAHEGKVPGVLADVLRGADAASLAGEAMGRDIERTTGVPVVTVTYDGTGSSKSDVVVPFIKYRRSSRALEG